MTETKAIDHQREIAYLHPYGAEPTAIAATALLADLRHPPHPRPRVARSLDVKLATIDGRAALVVGDEIAVGRSAVWCRDRGRCSPSA